MGNRSKRGIRHFKKRAETLVQVCRKQNLLITALTLWVIALILEVIIRAFNLYLHAPDVDLLSHFIPGIALGATAFWLADHFELVHHNWFAVGFSVVISLIWEGLEIIQDKLAFNPPHLQDIFFWDGVVDVSMALLGTLVYLMIKTFHEKPHQL